MHRNVKRVLIALGVTLLIPPAAISEGHERTPQAKVVQVSR